MNILKLGITVLTFIISFNALAESYSCESDLGGDSYSRITLLENGNLQVQFFEFHSEVEAVHVTNLSASTFNEVDTNVTIVNNVIADYSVEGDEGKAPTTVIFVYNPSQKAGRLTFVQDGRTMARNKLFTNCK
jgi:hypothetical protein